MSLSNNPRVRLAELRQRWDADRRSRIFLQLAEEYRRQGQQADAIGVLEVGLSHNPSSLAGQVALGRCLMEMGRYPDARDVLEAVLDKDPTQMVAYRHLVETHLALGEAESASHRLSIYEQLNPSDDSIPELEARIAQARRDQVESTAQVPSVTEDGPSPTNEPTQRASEGTRASHPPSPETRVASDVEESASGVARAEEAEEPPPDSRPEVPVATEVEPAAPIASFTTSRSPVVAPDSAEPLDRPVSKPAIEGEDAAPFSFAHEPSVTATRSAEPEPFSWASTAARSQENEPTSPPGLPERGEVFASAEELRPLPTADSSAEPPPSPPTAQTGSEPTRQGVGEAWTDGAESPSSGVGTSAEPQSMLEAAAGAPALIPDTGASATDLRGPFALAPIEDEAVPPPLSGLHIRPLDRVDRQRVLAGWNPRSDEATDGLREAVSVEPPHVLPPAGEQWTARALLDAAAREDPTLIGASPTLRRRHAVVKGYLLGLQRARGAKDA